MTTSQDRRGRARIPTIFAFAALLASADSARAELIARQVAAPASDIVNGIVKLPDPSDSAVASRAFVAPLRFVRDPDGVWRAPVDLEIETGGAFAVGLLGDDAASWGLFVRNERGEFSDITREFGAVANDSLVGDGGSGTILRRFDTASVRAGTVEARVESRTARPPSSGWLIARGDSGIALEAYVTTHRLTSDSVVAVAARLREPHDGAALSLARVVFECQCRTIAA